MASATRIDGTPVYTLAMGLSLMIFYAFAMQCMSTLAIVKRETKSWKYPIIQLLVHDRDCSYVCSWMCSDFSIALLHNDMNRSKASNGFFVDRDQPGSGILR